MKTFKIVLLLFCLIVSLSVLGQKYLGLSTNFGNQLKFTPISEGIKRPFAVSGNLNFVSQENINNNWVLQSSIRLGVLGHETKIVPYDTLTDLSDSFSFFSYSNFYGGIGVQIGKEIYIKNRTLTICSGAGGTYYYSMFPHETIYASSALPDGSHVNLFDAVIEFNNNSLIGFVKLSTLFQLNSSLVLGLEYSYHFKPIIKGQYQFYHTPTPSSGDITLNQNELSVIIMFKLLKENLRKEKALTLIRGQDNFYLGFDTSLANDWFKIEDDDNNLVSTPLYNVTWGFNVRKDIKDPIFIETGFIYKYYWNGIGFKNISNLGSGSGDNSWLIPLRFGLYANIYKNKVYFVPLIGYTFGINPPFGSGRTTGSYMDSNTVIEYQYVENPNVSRFFSLLQTGIGVEALLYNTLLFSISANYYSGFNTTTHLDITYTINNNPPSKAIALSKGQFGNLNVGLKYSFGQLFARK